MVITLNSYISLILNQKNQKITYTMEYLYYMKYQNNQFIHLRFISLILIHISYGVSASIMLLKISFYKFVFHQNNLKYFIRLFLNKDFLKKFLKSLFLKLIQIFETHRSIKYCFSIMLQS